jgi:hypothetical protein
MPSTTKAPALSQIDDAARQIESALVSHMEKKSEVTSIYTTSYFKNMGV